MTNINEREKIIFVRLILIAEFVFWTILILTVDIQPVGVNGIVVGFATLNCSFHILTGVNMAVYHITDLLGLMPIFCNLVCIM